MKDFFSLGVAKAATILPTDKDPSTFKLEDFFGSDNSLIINVTNIAIGLAGGIAVLFILIGAFYYFTAYGNEEKANKGKTTIMWAVIGVIIILLSKVLINIMINIIQ